MARRISGTPSDSLEDLAEAADVASESLGRITQAARDLLRQIGRADLLRPLEEQKRHFEELGRTVRRTVSAVSSLQDKVADLSESWSEMDENISQAADEMESFTDRARDFKRALESAIDDWARDIGRLADRFRAGDSALDAFVDSALDVVNQLPVVGGLLATVAGQMWASFSGMTTAFGEFHQRAAIPATMSLARFAQAVNETMYTWEDAKRVIGENAAALSRLAVGLDATRPALRGFEAFAAVLAGVNDVTARHGLQLFHLTRQLGSADRAAEAMRQELERATGGVAATFGLTAQEHAELARITGSLTARLMSMGMDFDDAREALLDATGIIVSLGHAEYDLLADRGRMLGLVIDSMRTSARLFGKSIEEVSENIRRQALDVETMVDMMAGVPDDLRTFLMQLRAVPGGEMFSRMLARSFLGLPEATTEAEAVLLQQAPAVREMLERFARIRQATTPEERRQLLDEFRQWMQGDFLRTATDQLRALVQSPLGRAQLMGVDVDSLIAGLHGLFQLLQQIQIEQEGRPREGERPGIEEFARREQAQATLRDAIVDLSNRLAQLNATVTPQVLDLLVTAANKTADFFEKHGDTIKSAIETTADILTKIASGVKTIIDAIVTIGEKIAKILDLLGTIARYLAPKESKGPSLEDFPEGPILERPGAQPGAKPKTAFPRAVPPAPTLQRVTGPAATTQPAHPVPPAGAVPPGLLPPGTRVLGPPTLYDPNDPQVRQVRRQVLRSLLQQANVPLSQRIPGFPDEDQLRQAVRLHALRSAMSRTPPQEQEEGWLSTIGGWLRAGWNAIFGIRTARAGELPEDMLQEFLDRQQGAVHSAADDLRAAVGALGDSAADAVETTARAIRSAAVDMRDAAITGTAGVDDLAGNAAADILDEGAALGTAVSDLAGTVLTVVGDMADAAGETVSSLAGVAANAGTRLAGVLGDGIGEIAGLLRDSARAVARAVEGLTRGVPAATAHVSEGIAALTDTAISALSDFATALSDGARAATGTLRDVVGGLAAASADLATDLGATVGAWTDEAGSLLRSIADTVEDALDGASRSVASLPVALRDRVLSFAEGVREDAGRVIPDLLGSLSDLAGTAMDAGERIVGAVRDAAGAVSATGADVATDFAAATTAWVGDVGSRLTGLATTVGEALGGLAAEIGGLPVALRDGVASFLEGVREDAAPVAERVLGAIGGLAGGAVGAARTVASVFDRRSAEFGPLAEDLATDADMASQTVTSLVASALGALARQAVEAGRRTAATLGETARASGVRLDDVLADFRDALGPVPTELATLAGTAMDGAADALRRAGDVLRTRTGEFSTILADVFTDLDTRTGGILGSLAAEAGALARVVASTVAAMAPRLSSVTATIRDSGTAVAADLDSLAARYAASVVAEARRVATAVGDALGGLVSVLDSHASGTSARVQDALSAAREMLAGITAPLSGAVESAALSVQEGLSSLGSRVAALTGALAQGLRDRLPALETLIGTRVPPLEQSVADMAGVVERGLADLGARTAAGHSVLEERIAEARAAALAGIDAAVGSAADAVASLTATLAGSLAEVGEAARDAAAGLPARVADVVDAAVASITEDMTAVADMIERSIASVAGTMAGLRDRVFAMATGLRDAVVEKASSAIESVGSGLERIAGTTRELAERAWSWLSGEDFEDAVQEEARRLSSLGELAAARAARDAATLAEEARRAAMLPQADVRVTPRPAERAPRPVEAGRGDERLVAVLGEVRDLLRRNVELGERQIRATGEIAAIGRTQVDVSRYGSHRLRRSVDELRRSSPEF